MKRSILLSLMLFLAAGVIRAAEPLSFYVNYDARVPTAPLIAHPLSIVHPNATVDLAAAHRAGNAVLAYISVGEVAADAPYRGEITLQGLPYAGRNELWRSDLIDLTDARWGAFLVDHLAADAVQKGFDGFFLDTLDAVELIAPGDQARTAAAKAGLVAAIKRLRTTYPQKKIVINRGFFAFAELRDSVDGVLVESVFSTHDFTTKAYRPVPAGDTAFLLGQLAPVTAAGRDVYILDYVDPADMRRADDTAREIRARGFHAFVSTPELDGIALAPLRPVPRRVASFYGNLTSVQEDQIKWPAESFTALRLQLPLEYLGYEVDYFKVLTPSDLPRLDGEYRAIVIPRFWEIPSTTEAAVVDWLVSERNRGKKILIFGNLPFRDREQRARFIEQFGLVGDGSVVAPPFTAELVSRDTAMIDYEAPVEPLQTGHLNLRAPAGAKKLLTVRSHDADGKTVVFDPIFTTSWGGVALDPYLMFRRADFRDFWHVDPFAFLRAALGDIGAPVPDTTTRDGLRMFMSHIDGDGFSNQSRVEPGRRSAEVVRDRFLKKYPLPVTVSIIEAEIRALVRNQAGEEQPLLEAIARDLFALPHVEIASHTFSHPFFWIEGDRTESFYDEQRLELKIDYAKFDLEREVDGSVRYINEHLAPPGRSVKVFLWSGNGRPPPEALAHVRRLGLENLNGGDTLITQRNQSTTVVAPRTMPWADELQIYAPNQNENVYTNNWRGPLFGTFTHVIDTFRLTESPRRLKPVNLYYHFYSGDYPASVQALQTIYDWVMTQPLHGVTISQYARMARDARAAALFSAGPGRWLAVTQGESRTFRLPADLATQIDLSRSYGVTGWKVEHDQVYVHTDGTPVVTLALATRPVNGPRLESSSGEISFRERTSARWQFSAQDLREISVILAGLKPNAPVRAIINGQSRTIPASTDGRLPLTLPLTAEVTLEFDVSAP